MGMNGLSSEIPYYMYDGFGVSQKLPSHTNCLKRTRVKMMIIHNCDCEKSFLELYST